MARRKGSLGRGLSAILADNITETSTDINKEINPVVGQTYELEINQITTNPFQPRITFNQDKLHELASSIEQLGIIQPITVRKLQENKYQLIAGERRFRASQLAGLNKIPSFIRIANDQEMLEMALVENIQRENLNPIEIALSYQRLIDEVKLTQEQCSERVGKNRSTITNFLRLLKLPSEIQKGLSNRKISTGHARALINVQNSDSQINIYHDIIANGYSVREVEQLAKDFCNNNYKRTSKKPTISNANLLPFQQQKMAHDLSKKLENEVELKRNKKGKGKLIIYFNNDSELTKIFEKINN